MVQDWPEIDKAKLLFVGPLAALRNIRRMGPNASFFPPRRAILDVADAAASAAGLASTQRNLALSATTSERSLSTK